ncbi:hypothetical protein H261_14000 [Paramagnetospirillum caucaseum]|uniref:Uncharacterized protein n=1 Tax=Paramagnetospirillum caucaseum TaxID=1244869 RepID=M3A9Z8_9PROT|nr:winged helix-turn-helix transcriptional regulator [Paramagnetospirillum caucaseum]EME69334.1 hypothetical protein H261_14000 [Paramagnetospirillum caucaseum]
MRDSGNTNEVLASRFDQDSQIMLGLLTAVHGDSQLTQRSIASQLDVALGLVNSYLKRCLKKGLIKVTQAPARRYCYYLTPQGLSEKGRLTAEYLSQSFKLLKYARLQCLEAFAKCKENGWTRIALVGGGDLADVAELVSHAAGIKVVAILDENGIAGDCGAPVARNFGELPPVDAVLITAMPETQAAYELARRTFPEQRIFTLHVLHVNRGASPEDGPS